MLLTTNRDVKNRAVVSPREVVGHRQQVERQTLALRFHNRCGPGVMEVRRVCGVAKVMQRHEHVEARAGSRRRHDPTQF